MKTPLTAQRLRELLHYDPETGLLTRLTDNKRGRRIGDEAGSLHASGSKEVMVDGINYRYHRVAWLHFHGVWPTFDIDHINGNKADNRISNLRDVPEDINMQNERRVRKNNKSGFMGVHWRADRSSWVASIRVNGKSIRLGSFATAEEAEAAYIAGKRLHHPGFTL
jgi:hypothetical protein